MNVMQLLTMSQTLCDAQVTIESLRTQLQQAQNERNEARREVDCMEMRAMIERGIGRSRYDPSSLSSSRLQRERHGYRTPRRSPLQYQRASRSPLYNNHRPLPETPIVHRRTHSPFYGSHAPSGSSHHQHRVRSPHPSRASPDRRVRRETFFSNGGRRVDWVGGSDGEDFQQESFSPGTISYTVNALTPLPASNTIATLPDADKLYNNIQPQHSP